MLQFFFGEDRSYNRSNEPMLNYDSLESEITTFKNELINKDEVVIKFVNALNEKSLTVE